MTGLALSEADSAADFCPAGHPIPKGKKKHKKCPTCGLTLPAYGSAEMVPLAEAAVRRVSNRPIHRLKDGRFAPRGSGQVLKRGDVLHPMTHFSVKQMASSAEYAHARAQGLSGVDATSKTVALYKHVPFTVVKNEPHELIVEHGLTGEHIHLIGKEAEGLAVGPPHPPRSPGTKPAMIPDYVGELRRLMSQPGGPPPPASPGTEETPRQKRHREQAEAAAEWAKLKPGDKFEVKSDGSSAAVSLTGYEVIQNDSGKYGPSLRVRDSSGHESTYVPDLGERPKASVAGSTFKQGEPVVRPNGKGASVLSTNGDEVTVVYRSGKSNMQSTFKASQLQRVAPPASPGDGGLNAMGQHDMFAEPEPASDLPEIKVGTRLGLHHDIAVTGMHGEGEKAKLDLQSPAGKAKGVSWKQLGDHLAGMKQIDFVAADGEIKPKTASKLGVQNALKKAEVGQKVVLPNGNAIEVRDSSSPYRIHFADGTQTDVAGKSVAAEWGMEKDTDPLGAQLAASLSAAKAGQIKPSTPAPAPKPAAKPAPQPAQSGAELGTLPAGTHIKLKNGSDYFVHKQASSGWVVTKDPNGKAKVLHGKLNVQVLEDGPGIPGASAAAHDEQMKPMGAPLTPAQAAVASPAYLEALGTELANSVAKFHGKVIHNPNEDTSAHGSHHPNLEAAPDEGITAESFGSLAGKHIVVTGVLPGHTRSQAEAKIAAKGGKKGNIDAKGVNKPDLLIVGAKAGTKLAKAHKLGIPVMTWSEAHKLMEARTHA